MFRLAETVSSGGGGGGGGEAAAVVATMRCFWSKWGRCGVVGRAGLSCMVLGYCDGLAGLVCLVGGLGWAGLLAWIVGPACWPGCGGAELLS